LKKSWIPTLKNPIYEIKEKKHSIKKNNWKHKIVIKIIIIKFEKK
jgi:hypothetical protein